MARFSPRASHDGSAGGLPLEFGRMADHPAPRNLTMKSSLLTGLLGLGLAVACAAEVPKAFQGLFKKDELIKAEMIVVIPPKEIEKYVAKVEEAAAKDPEWFDAYSKEAAPGVPLPYHEKLALTKEEYGDYIALWAKREYRAMARLVLQLREPRTGEWIISATGEGSAISTLRYMAGKDVFESPNGTLARIEDIDADEQSILGKWGGLEWKFLEETSLGKTKENLAIGRTGDGKYGLLVYRMQEVSSQGTRLYDKSMVIRFSAGSGAKPAGSKAKP